MLENEDSVVTSLNELRKLKHERITRQTQSRAVVGGGRAAALAVDPASEQMTPPPVSVSSLSHAQPAPFGNLAPQAPAAPFGNFAAQAGGYAAPPIVQTKTSYKAAVVMTLLLGGVGAAGYMKFDGEMRALRTAKENAVKDAEQARMQSAEMVAKAEVQARNNLRQCEDKLKAAAAVVPAAPAATTPSAPAVVEKKPEKPAAAPKVAARAASHKVAARPTRRAAAEPAAAKKEKDDVPNIAKKKKLDNDPLAGLGKL